MTTRSPIGASIPTTFAIWPSTPAVCPRWPKLLTYQEVDLEKVLGQGSVRDLLQAPILFISGADDPKFTDAQVQLLRTYVDQGGFIFAVNNCNGSGFDDGIRSLASRIYASGDAQLKRLPPEHPIYRAEYPLDPEAIELWGVDFGCRHLVRLLRRRTTPVLWDKWSFQPLPKRTAAVQCSCCSTRWRWESTSWRMPRAGNRTTSSTAPQDEDATGTQDHIERGLLQVAKLRHTGDWDAAPRALHNVLVALNRTSGLLASTHQKNLRPQRREPPQLSVGLSARPLFVPVQSAGNRQATRVSQRRGRALCRRVLRLAAVRPEFSQPRPTALSEPEVGADPHHA